MLSPKRTKFRKAHKGRIHGNAKGGTQLNFGSYGLKAMSPERVTARQIEAARRAITRHLRRTGRPHRAGGGCDHAPAVRVAAIDVRDKSHADRVMVSSGEQAGPGR